MTPPYLAAGLRPLGQTRLARGHVTRNPAEVVFAGPLGRLMLVASFGGRSDTTYVHVVARPAP